MPVYPTKEQILENLYQPFPVEKERITTWKKYYYNKKWKQLTKQQKVDSLTVLVTWLSQAWNVKVPGLFIGNHEWQYDKVKKTILIDEENPSIISILHEFGHYLHFSGLFPEDKDMTEFVACRYSTGIFKACFPKSYSKLVWENHTLVAIKDDSSKQ